MKSKKKINKYELEKRNKKIKKLENYLQALLNEQRLLKEEYSLVINEYKETCEILKEKDNEKDEVPR
jgi:hypothetical protein